MGEPTKDHTHRRKRSSQFRAPETSFQGAQGVSTPRVSQSARISSARGYTLRSEFRWGGTQMRIVATRRLRRRRRPRAPRRGGVVGVVHEGSRRLAMWNSRYSPVMQRPADVMLSWIVAGLWPCFRTAPVRAGPRHVYIATGLITAAGHPTPSRRQTGATCRHRRGRDCRPTTTRWGCTRIQPSRRRRSTHDDTAVAAGRTRAGRRRRCRCGKCR